jgi:hypothetical protein
MPPEPATVCLILNATPTRGGPPFGGTLKTSHLKESCSNADETNACECFDGGKRWLVSGDTLAWCNSQAPQGHTDRPTQGCEARQGRSTDQGIESGEGLHGKDQAQASSLMADTTTVPIDPVTGLISVIQFSKAFKSKDVFKKLEDSGVWYDAQQLSEFRDRVVERPRARAKVQRNVDRVVEQLNNRIDYLEDQYGEVPDDDFMGGGGGEPSIVIGQQELSPVFGGAAGAGAIRSTSAILKENKARLAKAQALERELSKVPDYKMTASDKAKRLLNIAKKQFDADKLRKLGAKIFKKVKPASVGRIGGATGVIIGLGGQTAIDILSGKAEEKQFKEMEKILKRQQKETDKIIKAGKSKAKIKSAELKKAQRLEAKAQRARTKKLNAATKKQIASQKAADKARAKAAETYAKGVTKRLKAEKKAQAKKAKVLRPGGKISAPTKPSLTIDLLKIAERALLFSSRGKSSSSTNFSPSSVSNTSFFSSPSPRFTPTRSGELCPCPKPRKKSDKKRKKPRICVTPAAARRAGLIN